MTRRILAGIMAFSVAACGGDDKQAPPPPAPNAAPQITSMGAATVTQGATGAVYKATATDPEGAPLAFSIVGGADQAQFQITPQGALTFRSPPNFSSPADQNQDNIYLVRIAVSDGSNSSSLDLTVNVVQNRVGFRVRRVTSGLELPVFVAPVPESDQVFVTELSGKIRVLDPKTGAVAADPYLDLSSQISRLGEGGLLGFATAPDFSTSRAVYVYLVNLQGVIEVRRYRSSQSNPNIGDPSTAETILTIPHPDSNVHYGGWIGFGPDKLLYIASGDGGLGASAADRFNLLGKVLRIDPSSDAFPGDSSRNYAIPATNPFAGGGGAPEVLAYGLRNPFRNSFDGDRLFIGDVGQGSVEEIDILRTTDGAINFGWPVLEGTYVASSGSTIGLTPPVAEYLHGQGPLNGNAIIGGIVYRGPIASLQGSYIFGDLSQKLWAMPETSLIRGQTQPSSTFIDRLAVFAPDQGAITTLTSFGTDRAGNLYFVDLDGEIFVLEPDV
ncbi:MAG: PQQ-dependent sugar dehydrogenase [Porphyrobacter sp.]|nr:PQQ-dependent sugar dehydrogenase [Porphyrobacter sp.]